MADFSARKDLEDIFPSTKQIASRTFDLDLNSLTALVESDGSTDYVVVYEAGVGHKKMLINDLLDGGQF